MLMERFCFQLIWWTKILFPWLLNSDVYKQVGAHGRGEISCNEFKITQGELINYLETDQTHRSGVWINLCHEIRKLDKFHCALVNQIGRFTLISSWIFCKVINYNEVPILLHFCHYLTFVRAHFEVLVMMLQVNFIHCVQLIYHGKRSFFNHNTTIKLKQKNIWLLPL